MAHKTRKTELPYMITAEDALLTKRIFDYLYNQASAGKVNIYIDPEKGEISAFSKEEKDAEKISQAIICMCRKEKKCRSCIRMLL